jgi:hypothetical protein
MNKETFIMLTGESPENMFGEGWEEVLKDEELGEKIIDEHKRHNR